MEETLKLVPSDGELIRRLEERRKIENEDDLETAGVLASLGHLDTLKILELRDLDASRVPANLTNGVAKVVRRQQSFHNVTGFCVSMLENINCDWLLLFRVKIADVPVNHNFNCVC